MTFISIVFENVYMVKLVRIPGSGSASSSGRVRGLNNDITQMMLQLDCLFIDVATLDSDVFANVATLILSVPPTLTDVTTLIT